MALNMDVLGALLEDGEVDTIEALVVSVQAALQRAMTKHGVCNRELAERLGMSPARVSQIFSSNGPNLTLKTVARVAHALNEEFEMVPAEKARKQRLAREATIYRNVIFRADSSTWKETASNTRANKEKCAA